ncbi:conserved hypothetical protein [Culex quinquefasciatus]|uniref:Uncharacterized protein n=1 Tax=Culex quinquefasciatus TaxID=7176 RepID=B0WUN9_CULQU|nr:conserved hypothetical protein [Culex quinquefasciatus]|eukprot:XP_001870978.1 conserved hypothetical protein [Culex quinquefasciatus]
MVAVPIRKRTLDYSHKFRNLIKFSDDVAHFLEEYDQIMQHRHVYRRKFPRHLREIESNLRLLISKFETLRAGGARNQLFQELFCCGTLSETRYDLREHYFQYHNTPRLVHPNIVELRSGHGKLEHFRSRLGEYLAYGTEYTAALMVNLKKLWRCVSITLMIDEPIREHHFNKIDRQIYLWKEVQQREKQD